MIECQWRIRNNKPPNKGESTLLNVKFNTIAKVVGPFYCVKVIFYVRSFMKHEKLYKSVSLFVAMYCFDSS